MARAGIYFLILGLASLILPFMGFQFRFISIFGDAAPFIGIGLAVVGIILLVAGSARNRPARRVRVSKPDPYDKPEEPQGR